MFCLLNFNLFVLFYVFSFTSSMLCVKLKYRTTSISQNSGRTKKMEIATNVFFSALILGWKVLFTQLDGLADFDGFLQGSFADVQFERWTFAHRIFLYQNNVVYLLSTRILIIYFRIILRYYIHEIHYFNNLSAYKYVFNLIKLTHEHRTINRQHCYTPLL